MSKKDTLYARMLSGDISPEEEKDLKASGEWDEIEKIVQFSDQLSLPSYDESAAFRKLDASLNTQTAKTRTLNRQWYIGIAASLLLLVTLWFLWPSNTTTLYAPLANTLTYEFEDGSTVQINDGSSLSFMADQWQQERSLQLEGEAFFEVEKGSPFTVHTQSGEIEVLGTSFNIRNWEEALYVNCYTGRVAVRSSEQEVILQKGQAVVFKQGQASAIKNISVTQPAWLNAVSAFEAVALVNVFKEVERQFNIKVNNTSSERLFTGSFSHQSLEQALEQICIPMGLNFTINDKQNTVDIID